MPTEREKLGEKLRQAYLEKGATYRKSPIGIDEFLIPPNQQNTMLKPNVYGSTMMNGVDPYIVYRDQYANSPEIQNHERIHAGQELLQNKPSIDQVSKIFGSGIPGATNNYPASEVPAYAFQDSPEDIEKLIIKNKDNPVAIQRIMAYKAEQQAKYNKYIDMIYKLNPGNSQVLESSMPQGYNQQYTQNHPRPLVAPQVNMQEQTLMNAILGKK